MRGEEKRRSYRRYNVRMYVQGNELGYVTLMDNVPSLVLIGGKAIYRERREARREGTLKTGYMYGWETKGSKDMLC